MNMLSLVVSLAGVGASWVLARFFCQTTTRRRQIILSFDAFFWLLTIGFTVITTVDVLRLVGADVPTKYIRMAFQIFLVATLWNLAYWVVFSKKWRDHNTEEGC